MLLLSLYEFVYVIVQSCEVLCGFEVWNCTRVNGGVVQKIGFDALR